MIEALSGKIVHISSTGIILDVSGVGYGLTLIPTSLSSLPSLGENLSLSVYTKVREDALELYGFLSRQERQLFVVLIALNGIGPKVALAILASLSIKDLIKVVEERKIEWLTMVPGIGKRTAEKLIVELQGKLSVMNFSEASLQTQTSSLQLLSKPQQDLNLEASKEKVAWYLSLEKDLHSALTNLGLRSKDISQVLLQLKQDYQGEPLGPLIRKALLLIGSKKKVQKSEQSLSRFPLEEEKKNLDDLF